MTVVNDDEEETEARCFKYERRWKYWGIGGKTGDHT